MLNTLAELFEEQIKDLYSAENQLTKALPKMIKAASATELKNALSDHLEQTKEHVSRLEEIAEAGGFKPSGKVCAAMKGLCEEGAEVIEEDGDESVIDAALVAAGQRVEHYEISAYGSAAALAKLLGQTAALDLLEATLGEEEAADKKLTDVVTKSIYPNAPKAEGTEEEDEEDEEDDSKSSEGMGQVRSLAGKGKTAAKAKGTSKGRAN